MGILQKYGNFCSKFIFFHFLQCIVGCSVNSTFFIFFSLYYAICSVYLPCKCLIIFKKLSQSLKEESEFSKFQQIISMFAVALRFVFGKMKCTIDSLKKNEIIFQKLIIGGIFLFFQFDFTKKNINCAIDNNFYLFAIK